MSLISIRVKRPDAAHHQDGRIYKTGEVFQMEEAQFKDAERGIPGFFERADALMEQIKSKDLPQGQPIKGPAKPAVQEPKEPKTEEERLALYNELIASGLSDAEARGTAWPEPKDPDVDPALKAAGIEDPNKSQIEKMGGDPVDSPVTKKELKIKKK
jgi:hypothetical protein